MAIERQPFQGNPVLGLMLAMCGWNRPPSGMESDFNELVDDPVARLSRMPIEFPSLGFRIYLIWLPMFLLAEWLIKVGILDRAVDDGRRWIAAVAAIAVLVAYLIVPLIVLKRRLRLDSAGFHLVERGAETLVPWTSLHSGRDWSIGFFQIKIPMVGTAKEEIVTTRDSVTTSISDGGKPIGFQFNNDAEITLTWPFHLDPQWFVSIAQQMSYTARAGADFDRLPAVTIPSRFDEQSDRLPVGIRILSNGTLNVPVSSVTFSDACCRCGAQTDSTRQIHVATSRYWWFPSQMGAQLEMPVCPRCWTRSWIRCLGVIATIQVIWTLLITYCVFGTFSKSLTIYSVVAVLAILLTRYTLPWIPALWWRVANVALNFSTSEFRFRFAQPNYHERMLTAIRDREHLSSLEMTENQFGGTTQ